MLLIYKLPNQTDRYSGVMTAPHASVTWIFGTPLSHASLHTLAGKLGVQAPEIDAVLENACENGFGRAPSRREPMAIDTRQLTYPGVRLLLKHGEGYVGVITGTHWAPRRRVKGVYRCDWVFTRPISQSELVDGMNARGHHPIDTWDLIGAADENGWGYV